MNAVARAQVREWRGAQLAKPVPSQMRALLPCIDALLQMHVREWRGAPLAARVLSQVSVRALCVGAHVRSHARGLARGSTRAARVLRDGRVRTGHECGRARSSARVARGSTRNARAFTSASAQACTCVWFVHIVFFTPCSRSTPQSSGATPASRKMRLTERGRSHERPRRGGETHADLI